MSYFVSYLDRDDTVLEDGDDVASTSGLNALQIWAGRITGKSPLRDFITEGEISELAALAAEVRQRQQSAPATLIHILERLLAAIQEAPEGTQTLILTDGVE